MFDEHDDSVHKHHATPDLENILLLNPETDEDSELQRNKKLQKTITKSSENSSELEVELSTDLPNEFTMNPQILKGTFPELFFHDLDQKQL